ncbi:MAG: SOS response-associated peptidase [Gemmatimonadaceae bacterium]
MCGRSSLHDDPTNILERFSLPPTLPGFAPHYNIAPTQLQWTISRDNEGAPVARQMKWGLVPSWAADPSIGHRMINARAESLNSRPAFRDSLESRRCVILADGYYEWKVVGKSKVPFYFRLNDGRAFGLAGLWDRWERGDTVLETCTVITTDASAQAATIHDRMPVLLMDDAAVRWLEDSLTSRELQLMLAPYDRNDLELYEVGRFVNKADNDSEDCIARVQPAEGDLLLL